MTSRMMKTLCILSLALNVGFVGMAAYRYGSVAGGEQHAPSTALADRLGLDASQRAAWDALEPPFLQDLAANWADIRVLRQTLLDEIFADQPDRQKLSGLQTRIAALQDGQQKRVIAQLLAERDVLNAGQQSALKALLLQEYGEQASQAEHLHR
ncbi:Spy/CpxP family protein refolding chaperone [Castellaniella sp.]|uniref:Spy/CpxP family protein refolding chaperone n=1 Tax=Castellaniella sp. TaxID=1955812 RepID=UPI002AFE064F|nr:periplasmic heavy metal sensor [Castellaniella sp.]